MDQVIVIVKKNLVHAGSAKDGRDLVVIWNPLVAVVESPGFGERAGCDIERTAGGFPDAAAAVKELVEARLEAYPVVRGVEVQARNVGIVAVMAQLTVQPLDLVKRFLSGGCECVSIGSSEVD